VLCTEREPEQLRHTSPFDAILQKMLSSPAMDKRGSHVGRRVTALLVLAVLTGFALRVYLLDAQELWGDEAMSTCIAQLPLAQALAPRIDTHPPLFYVLLNLWVRAAGMSLFALRLLPVALSLPGIVFAYHIGRRLVGPRTGLVAAWLVGLSPLQVYYAQELRMYSLVATLGMASMLGVICLLQAERPRPAAWAAYLAATLAATYSHYQAFPLIAAQNAVVLAAWRKRPRRLLAWCCAMLALAIAYLPWALTQLRFLGEHSSGKAYALSLRRLGAIAWQGLQSYALGLTASPRLATAGTLCCLLLAALGAFALRRHRQALAILVAWPAASIGLWWLADPLMPFYHSRFVMAGGAALLLLVAAGADQLWRSVRTRPALLALPALVLLQGLALRGWYTDPAYRKGDYGQALAGIASRFQPGDLLLLNNREQLCLFDYYRPDDLPWAVVSPGDALTAEGTDRALRQLTDGYSRVWLITYGHLEVFDPQRRVEQWLGAHGYCAYYQSHQGFYVNLYLLGEPPRMPTVEAPVQFEDGIRLLGYDVRPQPVPAGGTLLVTFYWQADTPPHADYTITAQLLDERGTLVAQFDGQPANGARPTSGWQPGETIVDSRAISAAGLPPGTYDLWVGLYTWPDIVRLRLADGSGADAWHVSKVLVQ